MSIYDAARTLRPVDLWGDFGSVEVVGSQYRQEAFRVIFGSALHDRAQALDAERALLVPEPSNPADRNAIAVLVRGQHVGYLSSGDAARYQPVLGHLAQRGWVGRVPAWVRAYPRFEYDYDVGRDLEIRRLTGFGAHVYLTLAEPHLLLPRNPAPAGPFVELPSASGYVVKPNNSAHRVIAPFIPREGQGFVYVTLQRADEPVGSKTREGTEVRVNARPVGFLTPQTGRLFLPLLDELSRRGLTCAARGLVTGNSVTSDLKVATVKPAALSEEWMQQNVFRIKL